jgi:hypothetical protein
MQIMLINSLNPVVRLTAYKGAITVSPSDPELAERLRSEPVEFDCNTLDEQAENSPVIRT